MFNFDVNMDEFFRVESEKAKWLAIRPKCSICGEPIQEESALRLDGNWICQRCVEDNTEWIEE